MIDGNAIDIIKYNWNHNDRIQIPLGTIKASQVVVLNEDM